MNTSLVISHLLMTNDNLFTFNLIVTIYLGIVMMQETDTDWSKTEKKVAQEAFKRAYEREIAALIKDVRENSSAIANLDDLWRLHDFLSARRHDIDGKYDYRYSVLIFVFARLIKEGWLQLDDLEGLDKNKLTKILSLSRM